jgi:hypothetical protein
VFDVRYAVPQYNQRTVKRYRDVQTLVWDSHEGVNPIAPFDLPLVVEVEMFLCMHCASSLREQKGKKRVPE